MKGKLWGLLAVAVCLVAMAMGGCDKSERRARVNEAGERHGDTIVVCGRRFGTGVRVVKWDEEGGYSGYLEHRFSQPAAVLPSHPAPGCNTPERYGTRASMLNDEGEFVPTTSEAVRALVRANVDQIVVHYDATGSSRRCFEVLHDERGLSAHFMIDLDGVIYQTLDVMERARHAGPANDRSVGIEIANAGAYETAEGLMAARQRMGMAGGRSGGTAPIVGYVQGRRLYQYGFTDAQYEALIGLTRALRRALPRLRAQCPKSADGGVADGVLPPAQLASFSGILGHFHVSDEKVDPGPAFDWGRYLRGL